MLQAFARLSFLFVVLFAKVVLAQSFISAPTTAPEFCVQNFNAYGPAYASNVRERTERFTMFLQAMPKCDVVQLQEAWNGSQIDIIESNLDQQYVISSPNRDSRIGLMSLVMGDIFGRLTANFQVNNDGGFMDGIRDSFNVKKAYHVLIARPGLIEEDFFFLNTHLHPASPAVRLTQILELLQWRLANQQHKLIFTGDINADIGSLERRFLMQLLGLHDAMEEYFGTYPKGYCTYCAANPLGWMSEDHTFDYVLFSNVGQTGTTLQATHGEVNMRGSQRQPWSDHYGVRVKLAVLNTQVIPLRAEQENRRVATLQMLKEAEAVLAKEKSRDFRPFVSLAQDLAKQLENQQGPFFDYVQAYR